MNIREELREIERNLQEALMTDLPMSGWTESRIRIALNIARRLSEATIQQVKEPL